MRNVNYDGGSSTIKLSVELYQSDHGVISIVNANPDCTPNFGGNTSDSSGYLINPEYFGISELIPMGSTRLPNLGGGELGYVDCALTSLVMHPVTKASAHLVTAFNDSGSGDELDVIVGDGADADGYLASAAVHVDQTEITYVANSGALLDNENGKVYTTADTIDILFTPDASTGNAYSLNELTAGEIKFKFEICDLN
jgi:hypothetical protein